MPNLRVFQLKKIENLFKNRTKFKIKDSEETRKF